MMCQAVMPCVKRCTSADDTGAPASRGVLAASVPRASTCVRCTIRENALEPNLHRQAEEAGGIEVFVADAGAVAVFELQASPGRQPAVHIDAEVFIDPMRQADPDRQARFFANSAGRDAGVVKTKPAEVIPPAQRGPASR